MFFSSSGELLLVSGFLLIQLLIRTLGKTAFDKGFLTLGNLILLSTVLTYYTLAIHVFISLLAYLLGKHIAQPTTSIRRRWAAIGILGVVILFCLRTFPAAFGIHSFQLGSDPSSIIQRLGISYIMFRHIQFIVDSYKSRIRDYHFLDYLNFILFFPNFLSGPIDKYSNFKRWADRKRGRIKSALILPGIGRILLGFLKKMVIVPLIYAHAVSYEPLLEYMGESSAILVSLVYYSAYIYLDFSGYSDIAIGSGYILGVRTPENFKTPYLATNIADFWRRWHITFSEFLRELIFKPLVKKITKKATKLPRLSVSIIGYLITFFICGLWHGDTANFLYWGLWHGVGLSIYKVWSTSSFHARLDIFLHQKKIVWIGNLSALLLTFSFVTFGWVFFHYSKSDLSTVFELLF